MASPTRPAERPISRTEAKAVTRSRLLDAALSILDEQGETALTTTNLTRQAGLAQSSFYVHFADMDDLLHELIEDLTAERRRLNRQARRAARLAPGDPEVFRDTFRIPIANLIAHPRMFRLLLRAQHDRSSPLGDWSRSVLGDLRQELIEDLYSAGMPQRTAADQRRASMVADGIMWLTHAMTLGHLDGRYPDIEEAVDVLVAFSEGYFPLLGDCPDPDAAPSDDPS